MQQTVTNYRLGNKFWHWNWRELLSNIYSFYLYLDGVPTHMQYMLFSGFSYKFNLEDGAGVKPHIPLLNNRIYDTKFESQFYMIYDSNKVLFLIFFLFNGFRSCLYLEEVRGGSFHPNDISWPWNKEQGLTYRNAIFLGRILLSHTSFH